MILCPFHEDKNPSCHVWRGKKNGGFRYHCFACGESGDAVDYLEATRGLSKREALQTVKDDVAPVSSSRTKPALPSPAPAEKVRTVIDQLPSNHEGRYVYRHGDGRIAFVVQRYAPREEGGKKFFGQYEPHGKQWTKGLSMASNRPLYGLYTLLHKSDPKKQVKVVEGEKCADLLRQHFPGAVVVSWCGGSKGWSQTDWSPLKGRKVLLVADSDTEGYLCMNSIAGHLEKLCPSIRLVLPPKTRTGQKAQDIGDVIERHHWLVPKWLKDNVHEWNEDTKQRMQRLSQNVERSKERRTSLRAAQHRLKSNEHWTLLGMANGLVLVCANGSGESPLSQQSLCSSGGLSMLCNDASWWSAKFGNSPLNNEALAARIGQEIYEQAQKMTHDQ